MRSTLPYHDPFDPGSANAAGFAGPLVNAEVILEIATAINPIDTGAITANAFLEHIADRTQKAFRLECGDGAAWC